MDLVLDPVGLKLDVHDLYALIVWVRLGFCGGGTAVLKAMEHIQKE
jgi:hypothetical protein